MFNNTHSNMNSLSITYAMEFRLKFAHNYQWSKCGKCFNVATGRLLKQSYKSRCTGYYIQGKFYSLTYLRLNLEGLPKNNCPF